MATRTTTKAKTAAKPKAASVTKPLTVAPAAPKPLATTPDKAEAAPALKKAEFIERVVARSGGKKKDVKPAVEAALAVLAEALIGGEEPNLPPLGKMRVTREKDLGGATMLVLRLKVPGDGPKNPAPSPLAENGEDS